MINAFEIHLLSFALVYLYFKFRIKMKTKLIGTIFHKKNAHYTIGLKAQEFYVKIYIVKWMSSKL